MPEKIKLLLLLADSTEKTGNLSKNQFPMPIAIGPGEKPKKRD
jgi:hypothetical protein